MQEQRTWRELLSAILANQQDTQRFSQEVQVTAKTLTQWACGDTNPLPRQLQQLKHVLPYYYNPLYAQTGNTAQPHKKVSEGIEGNGQIPSIFYKQILSGSATLAAPIRFWSLANSILQQALEQMDPRGLGLSLRLISCMPPATDERIHSLREVLGTGTEPWAENLEPQTILLGSESLAGYAMSSQQSILIDMEVGDNFFPMMEEEMSAGVYLIGHSNKLAGCLLIASTQTGYFTAMRHELAQRYADLLALVFEFDEFYDPRLFYLRQMPPPEEQQRYQAQFRRRVMEMLKRLAKRSDDLDTSRAKLLVWQQYEREFSQYYVDTENFRI